MTPEDEKAMALEDLPVDKDSTSAVCWYSWFKKHERTIRKALTPAKVDGDEVGELCAEMEKLHGCWRYWDGKYTVFTSLPERALTALQAATSQQGRQPYKDGTLPLKIINDASQQGREFTLDDAEKIITDIHMKVMEENPTESWQEYYRAVAVDLAAKGIIRVRV